MVTPLARCAMRRRPGVARQAGAELVLTSSRALLVRSRGTRADAHADSCIHRRPSISPGAADCSALRGKGARDRDRSRAELEATVLARRSAVASSRAAAAPPAVALPVADRSGDAPRASPDLVDRLVPSAGYRFDRALELVHRRGWKRRRRSGRTLGIAREEEPGAPLDGVRDPAPVRRRSGVHAATRSIDLCLAATSTSGGGVGSIVGPPDRRG